MITCPSLLGTGLCTTLNLSVPPTTMSGNGQYHVALKDCFAISSGFWLLRGEGEVSWRQFLGERACNQTQMCALIRYDGL
jgi:hypothetical protein